MAAKHKRDQKRPGARRGPGEDRPIGIRRIEGTESFELVHPRCVRERAEDIEEVETMLAAGESEIAQDELRWLLDGCPALIAAHKLLGEIALAEGDLALARGHLGRAYELGAAALPKERRCRLPYARRANRAFLEAGKGLAWCVKQLGDAGAAAEIIQQLLVLDPDDPLKIKDLLTAEERP